MQKRDYELLSLAFSYPGENLFVAIKEGAFGDVFGKTAPIPETIEELEVEYCRLFVGPGVVEVPPYESIYRATELEIQKGLVMGDVAFEVQNKYKKAGLAIKKDFTDMPDHIAVEILFVAYLEAMESSNPGQNYLEHKDQFMKEHLGVWVPNFIDAIKRKGHHPWYIYVAGLLEDTIMTELAK